MKNIPEILRLHKLWLKGNKDGVRANLHYADLHGANLHGAVLCRADLLGADLRGADLHGANLLGADLHGAVLHGANLRGAILRGADLRGADLRGADLCNVYLDYSSGVPLDCGGANFKADVRLLRQLMAHAVTIDCDDKEWLELKEAILPFAKNSHRAVDLGLTKGGGA